MKKKLLLIISSCLILITTIVGGLYWYTRQARIENTISAIADKNWKLVSHGEMGKEMPVIDETEIVLVFSKVKSEIDQSYRTAQLHIYGHNYGIAYRFVDESNLEITAFAWPTIGHFTYGEVLVEESKVKNALFNPKFITIATTETRLQLINSDNYSLLFELQE